MDKVIKVFVEDNDYLIERMVRDEFGWQVQDTFDPNNIDVLVFSGGADVSPHLYLEHNVASWCDLERDLACLSLVFQRLSQRWLLKLKIRPVFDF